MGEKGSGDLTPKDWLDFARNQAGQGHTPADWGALVAKIGAMPGMTVQDREALAGIHPRLTSDHVSDLNDPLDAAARAALSDDEGF